MIGAGCLEEDVGIYPVYPSLYLRRYVLVLSFRRHKWDVAHTPLKR